jgi:acyl-CoA synthetase (NDP forming)
MFWFPPKGGITLISQNEEICSIVITDALEYGLGFSKIISMGNKFGMNESDFIELLYDDTDTIVIMMYVFRRHQRSIQN